MSNDGQDPKRGTSVLDRELDASFVKRLENKLLRRYACGGLSLAFILLVLVPLFLIVSCVACADSLQDFPP